MDNDFQRKLNDWIASKEISKEFRRRKYIRFKRDNTEDQIEDLYIFILNQKLTRGRKEGSFYPIRTLALARKPYSPQQETTHSVISKYK